jgi:molybdopterin-binding protein
MYLNGNYQKIIGMEISGNSLQASGTYPGIEIGPNSQSTIITGNHIGERSGYQAATQSYAVKINSGALQVVITGNDLRNNVTSTILNGGDGTNSEYILGPNLGITTPDSFATKVVSTGFNVAFGPAALQYNVAHMSFFPAATLATGTLTLFTKPADFQTLTVFSTETITALTLTPGAGQFISTTCPSTISARGFISIFYNPSDATWYPCAESGGSGSSSGYPGAGIANSTGTAWGTSYTTTGTGTVVALATNPRFAGNVEITDASYFLSINASDPYVNFDSTDYLSYTRSSNKMNFVIGSSAIATITATGVGIGTASPAFPLEVVGTARASKLEVTDASYFLTITSSDPYVNFDSADYISYTRSSNKMNFVIGGSGVVVVTATSVGIGTSTPSATLEVNGTVLSGHITVKGDGSEGGQVTLYNAANSAGTYNFDVDGTGNGRLFTVSNNASLLLGQLGGTGGSTLFYTAATERMRITAAGNVGIGTSSPAQPLEVNGTARVSKLEVTDASYFLNLQSSDPYVNFDSSDYISYTRSSNTLNIVIAGVLMATVTSNGVTFRSYTVGSLPGGASGARAFVTDALAPVFGSAVSGGGSTHVPVYYDGSTWMVG